MIQTTVTKPARPLRNQCDDRCQAQWDQHHSGQNPECVCVSHRQSDHPMNHRGIVTSCSLDECRFWYLRPGATFRGSLAHTHPWSES